jgi:Na+/H+-translocating membrane pyrophosphatase
VRSLAAPRVLWLTSAHRYAWSEGIIIGLLVGAFALIGILILYQWKISGLLGLCVPRALPSPSET